MGKTKAGKRKPTLQLKETRRPVGYKFESPLEKLDFSKTSTAKAIESTAGASEDKESSMDPSLANFLEGMTSLAENRDKGSPATHLANGTPSDAEAVQQPAATSKEPAAPDPPAAAADPNKITFWQRVWDDNTNRHYYWDPNTNEVQWELPPGGVELNQGGRGEEEKKEAMLDEVDELMENYPYVKYEPKPAAEGEGDGSAAPADNNAESKSKEDPLSKSQQEAAAKPGKKRKATPEEETVRNVSTSGSTPGTPTTSGESVAKKPRLGKGENGAEEAGSLSKKKATAGTPSGGNKQTEQMMRFQVSNLADQFSRKLEYLHVSTQKLTSLETLAIQLQTRLDDWKEGGLPTKFMLGKLKNMNEELSKCESTAAPEGWKYVWDSSTCRYQFLNTSTGELTWEPPMQGPFSPGEEGQAESQDSEMEQETEMEKSGMEGVQTSSQEEQEEEEEEEVVMKGRVLGPALPPPSYIQESSNNNPPPPSSSSQEPYNPAEPLTDPLPVTYHHQAQRSDPEKPSTNSDASSVESKGPQSYLGPTADYLGSSKEEQPMVSMPPPRRISQKLLAIQKQKEERERLAEIERQSRPMTGRDVREKLRSKQPLWKQLAREREEEEEVDRKKTTPSVSHPQVAQEPPKSRQVTNEQELLTQYPPPGEEQELLTQYPPPGEDVEKLSQYPPPRGPAGDDSRVERPISRSRFHQDSQPKSAKSPAFSSVPPPTSISIPTTTTSSTTAAAPSPPSHHMQTGELVFSRDPAVAKQQKELYSQSPQKEQAPQSQPRGKDATDSPEISFKIHEVKLREKLVRRVQSFKIGQKEEEAEEKVSASQASSISAPSASRGEAFAEGSRQVAEAPPTSTTTTTTSSTSDELVVESTGEVQQDPYSDLPPATMGGQQALLQPSALPSTGFQASESREPETGIVEGETGEIMDKSSAEASWDVGMVGGGVSGGEGGGVLDSQQGVAKAEEVHSLEEGEMEEDDVDESRRTFQVEGKCYMDQHEGKDDVTKLGEMSADDSADSPPPKESKRERSSRRSRSPESIRSKSSKKKSRRHRDSDSDYERYSDSGYKKGGEGRKHYSHHSSRRHGGHRDRERYHGDSDSDNYHSSSRRRRGGGGGRGGREHSFSPDEYRAMSSRRSGKSSRSYGSGRYRSRSHSYDSDREREREKRKSASSSSKHKKKEKKKKRRRSSSRNRDGSGEDKASKPAPNVLVGKVGKISTVRALGQEKKAEESEKMVTDAQSVAQAGGNTGAMVDPMAMGSMNPQQQMSATYYQQPSTGQVPYYGTYPAYQYPYTQDPYAQQPQPEPEPPQPQAKWQWGDADPAQWAAKNMAANEDSTAITATTTTTTTVTTAATEGQESVSDSAWTAGTMTTQEGAQWSTEGTDSATTNVVESQNAVADPTIASGSAWTEESAVSAPSSSAVAEGGGVTGYEGQVGVYSGGVVSETPMMEGVGGEVAPVTETVSGTFDQMQPATLAEESQISNSVISATEESIAAPPPLPSEPEALQAPMPAEPASEEMETFVPVPPTDTETLAPPPPIPPAEPETMYEPPPPPVPDYTVPDQPAAPAPPAPAEPQTYEPPPLPVPDHTVEAVPDQPATSTETIETDSATPSVPVPLPDEPEPVADVSMVTEQAEAPSLPPPLPPPPPPAGEEASKEEDEAPLSHDAAEESIVEMEMEIESPPPPPPPPAQTTDTTVTNPPEQEEVGSEREQTEEEAEGKQEEGVSATDSTDDLYSFTQPISDALGKMEKDVDSAQEASAGVTGSEEQTPVSTEAGATPPPVSAAATYYPPNYAAASAAYSQQQAYNYAYAQNYTYAQAAYMQQAAVAAQYGAYGMQPGQYYPNVYGATAYGSYPTSTPGYYAYGGTTGYQAISTPSQVPVSPVGVPASASSATTTDAKGGKKGDFTLAGSKEKQMKSMMDKWKSFKDDKM